MDALDSSWKSLYKIAAVAALILLVYSLVTMVLLMVVGGQPESAQEGFAMLAENKLTGLLRLDILTIFAVPLYYLLFLGLYAALKDTHAAYALLAAALAFVGVTLFLASPSAFSFLSLSEKFAAATSVAQREHFLAAGEAILAADMWHSSSALVGGLLMQSATLLACVIMLWGKAFTRLTAWVGVVTHGLDLAHILTGFFLPALSVGLMVVAGTLYLLWFPLLARDFVRLVRE